MRGQTSSSFVLECVNDVAQRALIFAGGPREGERRRPVTASRALRKGVADDAPGRQRVAARTAQRRREPADAAPAGGADGAGAGCVKHRRAGRALGRERNGEERLSAP